ncbi:MAG: BamA/TamA family outer membrane protein [Thiomicrospira sp.]|uniref:autotransporter assembly complex protein TamA n=1 Tax=Thiomicrospira sp. TaxID=935 RepID=UPI0019D80E5F|nr:BamA/TamA family outer membrane protein [Thiomicrospira sp.]MBE0494365.1 BamA/TamA family outer membrane protein [Thiomicrospira sp.]
MWLFRLAQTSQVSLTYRSLHQINRLIWLTGYLVGLSVFANPLLAQPNIEVRIDLSTPNQTELLKELRANLSIAHLNNDAYPAQTNFLFGRGESELLNTLKTQGYYQAKIQSELERLDKVTRARFNIELGSPVKIRQLELQIKGPGSDLRVWRQYRQFDLRLKTGQVFKHQNYSDTLRDLTNLALDQGYMDADFELHVFRVYPHQNAVDIQIHLNTATSYQFGEVNFIGNQALNDDFLAKFVEFRPGDSYQRDALADLQKSLIDSGYFGLVRIEPQFANQQDGAIPIQIEVEDNLRHRYNVGGGFGSDTGARIIFGFENRLVNQQGHNYQVESVIGERAQSFDISYRLPGQRPSKQNWNIGLGWEATQSSSLKRSRTALTPEYVYQIDRYWRLNPFVSAETETYRYQDQQDETSQTLLSGVNLQKRKLNDEAYPSSGYRLDIGARTALKQVLSDTEFQQLELGLRGVISPIEFWRFHARARMVVTEASESETLPATYRYLLGGESLRGYGFESIGIETDAGLVGAKNMMLGGIETDYRFSKYLGMAVFSDAGQVFNDQPNEFKVGAGFGLRGFTPVGTAKLDIAWPISEDQQNWRLHFSIGLDL